MNIDGHQTHLCRVCNKHWQCEDCWSNSHHESLGGADYPCPLCRPVKHSWSYPWNYFDEFEYWVSEVRKAAGL